MQSQQFGEKAQKLMDRLSGICRKEHVPEFITNQDAYNSNAKTFYSTQPLSIAKSPQSQTILQLSKLEQQMADDQQDNSHKMKNLNDEIRKLESHIHQQSDSRVKINECFIGNVLRVQKNLHSALENVRKLYAEREKKLEEKIQSLIKNQDKFLNEQVDEQDKLETQINDMLADAKKLSEQLQQMKKNRMELEEKIFHQFNQQLKQLKTIFHKTVKNRQQRELRILQMLKDVYKRHSQTIKTEQINRQGSEKMFLTIIEQLIDRINDA